MKEKGLPWIAQKVAGYGRNGGAAKTADKGGNPGGEKVGRAASGFLEAGSC